MSVPGLVSIFDGHNDTLLQLHFSEQGKDSLLHEGTSGHIDIPRARRGGLRGGFFAIWVPPEGESPPRFGRSVNRDDDGSFETPLPPPLDPGYALAYATAVSEELHALVRRSEGAVELMRAFDDFDRLAGETVRVVLHLEGAEPVHPGLDNLQWWYDQGVRSIGPVWSRPNAFGHGVPFKYPSGPDTGPGLTEAGKALVAACNDLGILVDLAHLNERGFWDVADATRHPLVVTHACAHALAPTARNVTDQQIDAIAATGGVLGINFHVGDLRADGRKDPDTPLTTIVRHIDHVVERTGVEHVAFGSDFDGALMPSALGDATGLPRLVEALRSAGYDEEAIRKICHGNWLRVLSDTWRG